MDLTVLAKEFHVLPQPGGLLDQDYLYIVLLRAGLHGMSKQMEMERKKSGGR